MPPLVFVPQALIADSQTEPRASGCCRSIDSTLSRRWMFLNTLPLPQAVLRSVTASMKQGGLFAVKVPAEDAQYPQHVSRYEDVAWGVRAAGIRQKHVLRGVHVLQPTGLLTQGDSRPYVTSRFDLCGEETRPPRWEAAAGRKERPDRQDHHPGRLNLEGGLRVRKCGAAICLKQRAARCLMGSRLSIGLYCNAKVGNCHCPLRLSACDLALATSPLGRVLSFQKVLECVLQPHDVSESGRHLQDPSEDSQLAQNAQPSLPLENPLHMPNQPRLQPVSRGTVAD